MKTFDEKRLEKRDQLCESLKHKYLQRDINVIIGALLLCGKAGLIHQESTFEI